MAESLDKLLQEADTWTVHIERSSFDWENGIRQNPELMLHKGEELKLDKGLDPRLTKSKHVKIVTTYKDGGVLALDLTRRQEEHVISTDSTITAANDFDARLKAGASPRLITPGYGVLLALWPLIFGSLIYILNVAIDSNFRQWAFRENTNDSTPAPPGVFDSAFAFGVYTYPLALLVAVTIGYMRVTSGGLRIKRETITRDSIRRFAYKLRTETLRIDNLRQVWVGSAVGIIVALATFWFVK